MNFSRKFHTSCIQGKSLYVLGGHDIKTGLRNGPRAKCCWFIKDFLAVDQSDANLAFERLNLAALETGASWENLQLNKPESVKWRSIAVSTLDSEDLLILGETGDGFIGVLSACTFNTATGVFKKSSDLNPQIEQEPR